MMNLFKTQEMLRDVSKDQLVQMMQQPPGEVPPFLIMTELQRRTRMEQAAALEEGPPETTVAQDAVNAAGMPQPGLAGMAQAMAPQTDMAGNGAAMGAPMPQQAPAPVQQMREGGIAGVSANARDYAPTSGGIPRLITRPEGQFVEMADGSMVPLSALGFDQTSSTPPPRGFSMDVGPTGTQADLDQRQQERDLSYQSSRPMSPPMFGADAIGDIALPGSDGRVGRGAPPMGPTPVMDRPGSAGMQAIRRGEDPLVGPSEIPDVTFDVREGAETGGGLADMLGAISVEPQNRNRRGSGSSRVDPSVENAAPGDRSRGGGDRGAESGMDWEKFFFPMRGTPGSDQPEYPSDAFTMDPARRSENDPDRPSPAARPDEPTPDPVFVPQEAPQGAPSAGGGVGGGGSASAAAVAASSSSGDPDNARLLEQDKWLALARFGAALGASQAPTFGQAFGEAGNAGLDALAKARSDYQERKMAAEAMALQRQALAMRGSGGGGGATPKLFDLSAGNARALEQIDNQIAQLRMQANQMDERTGFLGMGGPNAQRVILMERVNSLQKRRDMMLDYMMGVASTPEPEIPTIEARE